MRHFPRLWLCLRTVCSLRALTRVTFAPLRDRERAGLGADGAPRRAFFFRAEKALPVAFVRPGGGQGLFTREAEEKLFRVAEQLGAEMLENEEELREYTREEAGRW